jgi:glutathione peroxidase-family protein
MKTNERLLAMVMFTAIGLVILLSATSCGSAKQYHSCDAYKTKYKPLKADHHKRHKHTCDAYN